KLSGSARARIAWDKWEGNFASEPRDIGRVVDSSTVEVDSNTTAVWITYDPDRTRAERLLAKLKDNRHYDAAKLTSLVACCDGPFGSVRARAILQPGKGPKHKGQVVVLVNEKDGHNVLLVEAKKRSGTWQPGITFKMPAEIEKDKAPVAVDAKGGRQAF